MHLNQAMTWKTSSSENHRQSGLGLWPSEGRLLHTRLDSENVGTRRHWELLEKWKPEREGPHACWNRWRYDCGATQGPRVEQKGGVRDCQEYWGWEKWDEGGGSQHIQLLLVIHLNSHISESWQSPSAWQHANNNICLPWNKNDQRTGQAE